MSCHLVNASFCTFTLSHPGHSHSSHQLVRCIIIISVVRFVFKIPSLQNSSFQPPFSIKHICIEISFSIGGPHLVYKYIYILASLFRGFGPPFTKYLFAFSVMKMNYFTVYKSIAIHFNIALRINSQSELTLICNWSEMNELQFLCCQLFL